MHCEGIIGTDAMMEITSNSAWRLSAYDQRPQGAHTQRSSCESEAKKAKARNSRKQRQRTAETEETVGHRQCNTWLLSGEWALAPLDCHLGASEALCGCSGAVQAATRTHSRLEISPKTTSERVTL